MSFNNFNSQIMTDFASIRQDYKKHELHEDLVSKNPIEQFNLWFKEAQDSGVPEPNAFTLATVGESGIPSARVVLLKGIDQECFEFYTNYDSIKGKEILDSPMAAMCFLWLELERQVRITGYISKLSREKAEVYFQSRPRLSQIGAWASPQSQTIASREYIENRFDEFTLKFSNTPTIPLPDFWGGYRIAPTEIEFWQGRRSRLHDRILYSSMDDDWKISRLAP